MKKKNTLYDPNTYLEVILRHSCQHWRCFHRHQWSLNIGETSRENVFTFGGEGEGGG